MVRRQADGAVTFRLWKSGVTRDFSSAAGVTRPTPGATSSRPGTARRWRSGSTGSRADRRHSPHPSTPAPSRCTSARTCSPTTGSRPRRRGRRLRRALSPSGSRPTLGGGRRPTAPAVTLKTPENGARWIRRRVRRRARVASGDDPSLGQRLHGRERFGDSDPVAADPGRPGDVLGRRRDAARPRNLHGPRLAVRRRRQHRAQCLKDVRRCRRRIRPSCRRRHRGVRHDRRPGDRRDAGPPLRQSVVPLGDLAYEDRTAAQYANCYDPTWGRHKAPHQADHRGHEYRTPDTAGYFGYFGAAAGDTIRPGLLQLRPRRLARHRAQHECSKIGGCGTGSPRSSGCARTSRRTGGCTLACSMSHGSAPGRSTATQIEMQPFWQALYDTRRDFILSGHEHVYERFAPQTPTRGPTGPGIRQITVGTGGRSHYAFLDRPPEQPGPQRRHLRRPDVTLRPGAYDWRFVPEAGRSSPTAARPPATELSQPRRRLAPVRSP